MFIHKQVAAFSLGVSKLMATNVGFPALVNDNEETAAGAA